MVDTMISSMCLLSVAKTLSLSAMFFRGAGLLAFSCLFVLQTVAQPTSTSLGNAAFLGNDCYQITPNLPWQLGAVWFNQTLDLTDPFTIDLDLTLGNADATGADGVVFVLQSVGPFALGESGGGLGFEGFNPSFGVEVDTWQNADLSDVAADHVAMLRDGFNNHNLPYNNLAGPVSARADGGNIEDGQAHRFRVEWNPEDEEVKLYFDCELRLSLNIDLITEIFSGNSQVWWGFTGSTGGSSNNQEVCIPYSAISLPPEHSICDGQGVLLPLQVQPGGTVSWDPVEGLSDPTSASPTASPEVTTIYTATYTDFCGEDTSAVTEVEVLPLPNPGLPDSVAICPGEQATLVPNSPPGAPTPVWSDGTIDEIWMGATPGWQAVTVLDADALCAGVDSTYVEALVPTGLSIEDLDPLCAGEEVEVPWPSGGVGWTVDGIPVPGPWTIAASGTFLVEYVEGATGCPMELEVTVSPLVPAASVLVSTLDVCAGDGVQLPLEMEPSAEVVWTPASGLDDPWVSQPIANPVATTIYTASVTNACDETELLDVLVTVHPLPQPILPDSAALCPGDQLTLSLTEEFGAPAPIWGDGTSGWEWTGSATGWMTVLQEVLVGCTGADSTYVSQVEIALPSLDVPTLCPGEFNFFSWPDGWTDWAVDGFPSEDGWTVVESGWFGISFVESFSGCAGTLSAQVPSGALPTMGLPDYLERCEDASLMLVTGVPEPVFWSDGATGSTRQVQEAGTYIATYTSECGTVSDTVEVVDVQCGCAVYAPGAFTPDGDLLNDAWRPFFECSPEEYVAQIFNRWGVLIWQSNNPEEFWNGEVDISGSPNEAQHYYVGDGIYTFQITYRDPTSAFRNVLRKTGHIQIIR